MFVFFALESKMGAAMPRPNWVRRLVDKYRWQHTVTRAGNEFVRLGLIRMEDRVLLDAVGLVAGVNNAVDSADSSSAEVAPRSDSSIHAGAAGQDTAGEQMGADGNLECGDLSYTGSHGDSSLRIAGRDLIFRDERGDRDNQLRLLTDGDHLIVRDEAGFSIFTPIPDATGSGTSEITIPFTSLKDVDRLVVDAAQGIDSVTFDLSENADAFLSQFTTTELLKSENHLGFVGDAIIDATYTLADRPRETASLEISSPDNTTIFHFAYSSTVDLAGMNRAELAVPDTIRGAEFLNISEGKDSLHGTHDALVVGGNTGNLADSTVHFYGNTTVVINAGAAPDADAQITVIGAANGHQNSNLVLTTGNASDGSHDAVTIDGAMTLSGDLTVHTGTMRTNAAVTALGSVDVLAEQDVAFLANGSIHATATSVSAADGKIRDSRDVGPVIVSNLVELTSASGIGSSGSPVKTSAQTLRLSVRRAGAVHVSETDAVSLADVRTAHGPIEISAGGSILIERIETKGSGTVTLSATGDIVLNEAIAAADGFVNLNASQDVLANAHSSISTVAGDIVLAADADESGNGTINFAGNIASYTGTTTFRFSDNTGQLSGAITGRGNLVKQGPGTLTITDTSANTYSGTTTISEGSVVVDGTIGPSAQFALAAGTVLSGRGDINAPVFADHPTAAIISTGNLSLGDGSAAGLDFAGELTVDVSHTVTIRDSDLARLGTLTTLAEQATLVADNGIEISSGDTLIGDGTVQGDLVVLSGGSVSPGTSPGRLATANGDLRLHPGALVDFEIEGQSEGSSDLLVVNGTVSLGNAVLRIGGGQFDPTPGTTFTLVSNDGTDPVVGTFVDVQCNTLAEGATLRFGTVEATISYAAGPGGNDVTLSVPQQRVFLLLDDGDSNIIFDPQAQLTTPFLFPESADFSVLTENVDTFFVTDSLRTPRVASENGVDGDLRLFFRIYDDELQREGEAEYDLQPEEALTNLPAFFSRYRFPDGQYNVYLKEAGSDQARRILKVHVYEGKVVPENFRDVDNETPAAGQSGTASEGESPTDVQAAPDNATEVAPSDNERRSETNEESDSSPQVQEDGASDQSQDGETTRSEPWHNVRIPKRTFGQPRWVGEVTSELVNRNWQDRVSDAMESPDDYPLSRAARLLRQLHG